MDRPALLAVDLESVLVPEIWEAVAQSTGLAELRLTTRDLPDYRELMGRRLALLDRHGLKLPDLLAVVRNLSPLPGATGFLRWARARAPLVVLSDTFYELASPLLGRIGHPLLLCHSLEVSGDGAVVAYRLRMEDSKRRGVEAFQRLGYRVTAVGDSHNDATMLEQAEVGLLFRPPQAVARRYPQFPVVAGFKELKARLSLELKGP